jgi:hypothetical protein
MAFEEPDITRITEFLEQIGIPVIAEPVAKGSFLPGAMVRDGALVFDPALPYPGDLLHEAGHIAVCDPALRPTLGEVEDSPAEEMASLAWSYAAARAIGLDPAVVFHPFGYKGQAAQILASFESGGGIGVPMLQLWGMTAEPHQAEARGMPPFPAMARWLR